MKHYKYFDFVMGFFVTVLLLSNLLSSAKIIDLGGSIGPVALVFDAGTLVFPISYIFGDMLTEVYGYKKSRRVIWMGFVATAMMGLFVWLSGLLPGADFWQETTGDGAYNAVLGSISALVVASLAAYFVGEFTNSYVLAKMKVATKGRWLPLRTIGSTLAGQAIDSVVFIGLATLLAPTAFPADQMINLILTNYILKVGIEVLLTPITVVVVGWLKRAENEDYYDTDTNFNPFKIDA